MATVRKDNPHTVRAESGRLSYRRVFPPELRVHIAALGFKPTELKRSLGASRITDPGASERWQAANAEWEAIVAQATKLAERSYDVLTPARAIALALDEERAWHQYDEQQLAERGEDFVDAAWAGWQEMLSEFKRWRLDGDSYSIVGHWGRSARAILAAEQIVLDPDDPRGLEALCTALNDRRIAYSVPGMARLKGEIVEVPPAPEPTPLSANPLRTGRRQAQSFDSIALGILSSPRQQIGPSTKQASMTALRFFREAFGPLPPHKITKALVSEWLDLMEARPSKVAADERNMPLRELVERYKDKEASRLSVKTLATQLGALSALWNKAQAQEGAIDAGIANPFVGRRALTSAIPEIPQELTAAELKAIFGLSIFTRGERPRGGKGEASYWLPLFLLWTGARPEEIAQLLVADIFKDPEDVGGRLLIRITDEGRHPHKGRQSLKTSKKGTGRRTFPLPLPLVELGLPAYLDHLRSKGEKALFPELRVKGERNLLFSGWGEWWSGYLQERKVLPAAQGRRASREFRHNWTTAARKYDVPHDAREYIQGHRALDTSTNDRYGSRAVLGGWIDKLRFDAIEWQDVKVWEPPQD